MRAVIQRVSRASVKVDGETVGEIGRGLLVLLGVSVEDTEQDADFLAEKTLNLRIFEDDEGKMNLSLLDVEGELLVVSQFTLYGDARKGRRPSFIKAALPERANELYLHFAATAARSVRKVETGTFRAMMDVELVNEGPVTILLDSTKEF
jgi:D-tyrosyl-tRNA(Tyr) deacylase